MRGPEHYREAERLIALVEDGEAGDTMLTVPELIGMAQVHAALAQTALDVEATGLDQPGTLGIASDWAHALNGGEPQ